MSRGYTVKLSEAKSASRKVAPTIKLTQRSSKNLTNRKTLKISPPTAMICDEIKITPSEAQVPSMTDAAEGDHSVEWAKLKCSDHEATLLHHCMLP